ncbi:MAG: PglZ domain-containing protein [Chloroflexi bacterium]|nr:PglZ domain-containing protein [Chloroflexota bacterium]
MARSILPSGGMVTKLIPTTDLGPVSAYVRDRLAKLLDERRVLVWYDPARDFAALVDRLDLPGCVLVSAAVSPLRARRTAESVYRQLGGGHGGPELRQNLLYRATARGVTPEQQQRDPFEAFARCGAAFGDDEAERLEALAKAALRDYEDEIARLFREARPTLDLLDALPAGARFPLVRQALDADAPVEAIVAALSRPDAAERLAAVPGALVELARLAQSELGLAPVAANSWPAIRDRLGRFILVGELAFDLPGGLPAVLAGVAHPDATFRTRVLAICDRLRDSESGREVYRALAAILERDLHLVAALGPDLALGERDTFPAQERARLAAVVRAGRAGDLVAARRLFDGASRSVWRLDPERALLWQVAQRCLAFLELAAATASRPLPSGLADLIAAYVAPDGLWQLDRAQRLFEQAGALSAHDDEVELLVQACRVRYRETVGRAQTAFQTAVRIEGWPPEALRRQTQAFDTCVAPELAERRKTAYFLVDSLRFEMGRDLAQALESLGPVVVESLATVLPTTTPCGMAALLPGADGAYSLVEHRSDLVPAIAGAPLPTIVERRALLDARLGDRYAELTLDELLSTAPKRLAGRLGAVDLVLVRTQDIDALGEQQSLFRARKVMSEVVGELRAAAVRLAGLGCETIVFVADHGHVLIPEILAGDVVAAPPGDWVAKKRRSLLGRSQAAAPGVLTFSTGDLGIVAPVPEFATPVALKTFHDGPGYFHEGLSLQECLVPAVVLRASASQPAGGGEQVSITYGSDRFTSSIVSVKVLLTAMFADRLVVRLEAFESSGPRARSVGQAGDSDVTDPNTGEVILPAGTEVSIPLVIDHDYRGPSVEIRATEPATGAILASLTLKNGRLD